MTPEAPEFHTQPLSPLSPLPIHPPEPSKIPVLQKQIDPVFNMTSTHLDPALPTHAFAAPVEPNPDMSVPTKADSPLSADSNFSDAYKEEPNEMEEKKDSIVVHDSDVSDDYGMAIDSDGEERTDSGDISQENMSPEATFLSDQTLPPSAALVDAHSANPVSQTGSGAVPTPSSPSIQTNSALTPESTVQNTTQSPNDAADARTHPYEEIASGGIDIQQLLDNITANAEKNEQTVSPNPPPSQSSLTSSLKPTSGLPTHSSLPPRPNLSQKRPYDDMQKYHANTPGLPPAASSYRNPGAASSIIAAGAPGTSTDPRGGLPPPPSATFRPPPPSASSPVASALSSQGNRLSLPGQSMELQDEADELDVKWGPEVQKVYDQFLDNERMYVTEGLWDTFPNGSRLFIGEPAYVLRNHGTQLIR